MKALQFSISWRCPIAVTQVKKRRRASVTQQLVKPHALITLDCCVLCTRLKLHTRLSAFWNS